MTIQGIASIAEAVPESAEAVIRRADEVRAASTHGALVLEPEEFTRLRLAGCAGHGTPMDPDAPGAWALVNERGATVLYLGVTVGP